MTKKSKSVASQKQKATRNVAKAKSGKATQEKIRKRVKELQTIAASGKAKAKKQRQDPEQEDRDHAAVRGTKCECGKVNTLEPLTMCESCPGCDTMMHTVTDQKKHLKCLEARREEPEETAVESAPKQRKAVPHSQPVVTVDGAAAEQLGIFFRCQRYPVLRSQIVTALMAGTPLTVERLPTHILLDVVLLATACAEYHNAGIVDDFDLLVDRVKEEWGKPEWTCKTFESIHAMWAGSIVYHGTSDFETAEERYIPSLAGWLLEQTVPQYFAKEITK